jgi:ParB family chromosome partitioning protein
MARTSPSPVPMVSASIDHVSASRTMLPPSAIAPDERNRRVVEDEDLELLCDSIRVSGVLQPVQVWRRADGTHRLIDGERRWRAAQKLGLKELPCEVWPSDSDPRRVAVAGLALNEHRKVHGCLQIARRLRDIKNESAFSHAQLAEHTGLPLDRVKTYFTLFLGSDDIFKFLEKNEVPLKVAAELVRYERATNEARARRLIERHQESPLTVQEIVALRKREQRGQTPKADDDTQPARQRRPFGFIERFEAEVRRDANAVAQLEDLARRLGYRLIPLAAKAEA